MNTTRSRFSDVKLRDPRVLGALFALVVAVALTVIALPPCLRSTRERRALQAESLTASLAVTQRENELATLPASLDRSNARAREQLAAQLVDLPSTSEAVEQLEDYQDEAASLGLQVVRLQAIPEPQAGEAASAYAVQRYEVEVRGEAAGILRFLSRIASSWVRAVTLDSLSISPGAPPIGQARLTMYTSDYAPGQVAATPAVSLPTRTAPTPTPTLSAAVASEVLHLETMMQAARLKKDWAAYIGHAQRILELDPSRQDMLPLMYDAHVAWAQLLALQGDLAGARSHYEEALRLVPGGTAATDGLRNLPDTAPLPTPTATVATVTPLPTAQPTPVVYRVRPGDTLSGIAQRYGLTVSELMTANNLRSTTIYVDQRLVIPPR